MTIYNLIRQGKFPKQIRIGTRSYWDSRLISAWIEERLAEGRAAATNTDKFAKLGKLSVAARREKRLEARA